MQPFFLSLYKVIGVQKWYLNQTFEKYTFSSIFISMLIFGEFLKQIFICFSIQPTKFTEHPKKLRAWNWVNKSELNIKHGMAGIWSSWQRMTQSEKIVFLRHGCTVCSIDQMDIFMVLDKYLANLSETSGDPMCSTRVLVIKLSKVVPA